MDNVFTSNHYYNHLLTSLFWGWEFLETLFMGLFSDKNILNVTASSYKFWTEKRKSKKMKMKKTNYRNRMGEGLFAVVNRLEQILIKTVVSSSRFWSQLLFLLSSLMKKHCYNVKCMITKKIITEGWTILTKTEPLRIWSVSRQSLLWNINTSDTSGSTRVHRHDVPTIPPTQSQSSLSSQSDRNEKHPVQIQTKKTFLFFFFPFLDQTETEIKRGRQRRVQRPAYLKLIYSSASEMKKKK